MSRKTFRIGRANPTYGTHMCAKWALAVGFTVLAAPFASGAEPVTASNWQRHPAIVEIRAIYQEVKQAEAAGRLRKLQRVFEHCQSYEDTERTLYLDARGAVRSYHFGGGSEDSAAQHAHYCDRDGRLRFVFITAAAVNGTSLEHRIYLSKDGKRLLEAQKRQGPGWTFPFHIPEGELVKDPKQAFHGESPCPEVKSN